SARFFWKKPRVARVARKTVVTQVAQVAMANPRCFDRHSPTAAGAILSASRSTAIASPLKVHAVSVGSPLLAPYCWLIASASPAMPKAAIASIAAPTRRGVAKDWRGFARGGEGSGEGTGDGGDDILDCSSAC